MPANAKPLFPSGQELNQLIRVTCNVMLIEGNVLQMKLNIVFQKEAEWTRPFQILVSTNQKPTKDKKAKSNIQHN